jgi:hypothetical protein
MAGFTFSVPCTERDRKLGVSTLIYFRKIAKRFGIETRYSYSTESQEFHSSVDAYLPLLQSLLPTMVQSLPAFATGFSAQSGNRRAKVFAYGLVAAYIEGMGQYIQEREKLTALARDHGLIVQDATLFFDVGRATHLSRAARNLQRLFMDFEASQISPETMVEEAHTFVGTALRAALHSRRSVPFGALIQDGFDQHVYPENVQEALADLNRLRVRAKHYGEGVASRTDLVFWFNVISGINMILDRASGRVPAPSVRDGPRVRDPFMSNVSEQMREVLRAVEGNPVAHSLNPKALTT